MDWKIKDEHDNFIQEVNCQYDSLDLLEWDNDAEIVLVNFKTKETKIIKKKGE